IDNLTSAQTQAEQLINLNNEEINHNNCELHSLNVPTDETNHNNCELNSLNMHTKNNTNDINNNTNNNYPMKVYHSHNDNINNNNELCIITKKKVITLSSNVIKKNNPISNFAVHITNFPLSTSIDVFKTYLQTNFKIKVQQISPVTPYKNLNHGFIQIMVV